MDYVIRFFDKNARGAREFRENGGEYAATAGIWQGMWYRALKDIKEKSDIIKPVVPKTIAKSIAIGNPADGYYAAQTVQKTSGYGEWASDDEIIEGIRLLAKTEGVFTETAGGTTIAVLKKLVESGKIAKNEVVVAYITGNGFIAFIVNGNNKGEYLRKLFIF